MKKSPARAPRRRSHPLGPEAAGLRERIVDTVRNIDRDEALVVDEVRKSVSRSLRAGGAMVGDTVGVVEQTVRGSLEATITSGTGVLVAVKAVAKGVILGISDVGGDLATAALTTVRATVHAAADSGTDLTAAAWRAIGGLVEAGTEIGVNVAQLVASGAQGALEAGAGIGSKAGTVVQTSLAGLSRSIANIFEGQGDGGQARPAAIASAAKRQARRPGAAKKKVASKAIAGSPARKKAGVRRARR